MDEDSKFVLGLTIGTGVLGFVFPLAWIATVICFAILISSDSSESKEDSRERVKEQEKEFIPPPIDKPVSSIKKLNLKANYNPSNEDIIKALGKPLPKYLTSITPPTQKPDPRTKPKTPVPPPPKKGLFSWLWDELKVMLLILAVVGFIIY